MNLDQRSRSTATISHYTLISFTNRGRDVPTSKPKLHRALNKLFFKVVLSKINLLLHLKFSTEFISSYLLIFQISDH